MNFLFDTETYSDDSVYGFCAIQADYSAVMPPVVQWKNINYSIRRCCYICQCATYTTLKELSNSDSVEISKRRKDIISATLRQLCANQINMDNLRCNLPCCVYPQYLLHLIHKTIVEYVGIKAFQPNDNRGISSTRIADERHCD